jgi:hypothetical protein
MEEWQTYNLKEVFFLIVITDDVNDFLKLDVFWHLYIVYWKEE